MSNILKKQRVEYTQTFFKERSIDVELDNCEVHLEEKFATIFKDGKKIVRKRLSTRGFSFESQKKYEDSKKHTAKIERNIKTLKNKILKTFTNKIILCKDHFDKEAKFEETTRKTISEIMDDNESRFYLERTLNRLKETGTARLGLHYDLLIIDKKIE